MYIEKTGNRYKYVQTYKDVLTGTTKRVSITLNDNKKATQEPARSELKKKIAKANCQTDFTEMTISDLYDTYINACSDHLKPSSVLTYKIYAEHLKCKIGHLNAQRVNSLNIKQYLDTPTDYRHIKLLFHWAYKQGILQSDELARLTPPRVHAEPKKHYLEDDELQMFLSAPEWKKCIYYKLLVQFQVLSGCRIGECLPLIESDFDFHNRLIHITKAVTPAGVGTPKTKTSIRDIYMQSELYTFCQQLVDKYHTIQKEYGYITPYIFHATSRDGKMILYSNYEHRIKEIGINSINIPVTSHLLRHTHTSLMFESGMSLEAISDRLGHKNDKVTREIYLHITERLKDKFNTQMDGIKLLS